jgi:hypothetical protein
LVRHHVLPGRRRREASGSRKTWLDPAGDLRHVGPATPAAVRHPTPRPLIYLPPADPFAGTPSPLPTVLTLPTLSAAAGTLLSLSPLRRRDPREREREQAWPARRPRTQGWTPSRGGSCSRTSERLSLHPHLLLPCPLSPPSGALPSAFAHPRSACPCPGTRIWVCTVAIAAGVPVFSAAQLCLPRRISRGWFWFCARDRGSRDAFEMLGTPCCGLTCLMCNPVLY